MLHNSLQTEKGAIHTSGWAKLRNHLQQVSASSIDKKKVTGALDTVSQEKREVLRVNVWIQTNITRFIVITQVDALYFKWRETAGKRMNILREIEKIKVRKSWFETRRNRWKLGLWHLPPAACFHTGVKRSIRPVLVCCNRSSPFKMTTIIIKPALDISQICPYLMIVMDEVAQRQQQQLSLLYSPLWWK